MTRLITSALAISLLSTLYFTQASAQIKSDDTGWKSDSLLLAKSGALDPQKEVNFPSAKKKQAALQIDDKTISLTGRKVILGTNGFPEQIQSFFTSDVTGIGTTPKNILGEGIHFHIVNAATHKDIALKSGNIAFIKKEAGNVQWQTTNSSDLINMDVNATINTDGFMSYSVKLTALSDVDLDDIKFHIPFDKASTKYLMGLDQKAGMRPDTVKWKWDAANKNLNGVWIGQVNAGLQYALQDENYTGRASDRFSLHKPALPASWANGGRGGILITVKGKTMLAENYSGPRSLKKGDTLYYNFTLMVTPVHMVK